MAEYDEFGKLIGIASSGKIKIEPSQIIAANVEKVISSNAVSAKIFVWESDSIKPITDTIMLNEEDNDYYADNVLNAQEYDIQYPIKGKINTEDDIDYIKIIPQTDGQYMLNCISSSNAVITMYNSNNGTVLSPCKSAKNL